jgi:hypothetical protein
MPMGTPRQQQRFCDMLYHSCNTFERANTNSAVLWERLGNPRSWYLGIQLPWVFVFSAHKEDWMNPTLAPGLDGD